MTLDNKHRGMRYRRNRILCVCLAALYLVACTAHVEVEEPTLEPTVTAMPTATSTPLPDYMLEYQQSCSTPEECGQKLMYRGWTRVVDGRVASPFVTLAKKEGDCGDIALTIAFGVEDDGYEPFAMYLVSSDNEGNHLVYIYQTKTGWRFAEPGSDINQMKRIDGKDSFSGWDSPDALFKDYNNYAGGRYYLYYLYDLNKVNELLLNDYGESRDWRTTEKDVLLIYEGVIDEGPKE